MLSAIYTVLDLTFEKHKQTQNHVHQETTEAALPFVPYPGTFSLGADLAPINELNSHFSFDQAVPSLQITLISIQSSYPHTPTTRIDAT